MVFLDKMVKIVIIVFLPIFLIIPTSAYPHTIEGHWVTDNCISVKNHLGEDIIGNSQQFYNHGIMNAHKDGAIKNKYLLIF